MLDDWREIQTKYESKEVLFSNEHKYTIGKLISLPHRQELFWYLHQKQLKIKQCHCTKEG